MNMREKKMREKKMRLCILKDMWKEMRLMFFHKSKISLLYIFFLRKIVLSLFSQIFFTFFLINIYLCFCNVRREKMTLIFFLFLLCFYYYFSKSIFRKRKYEMQNEINVIYLCIMFFVIIKIKNVMHEIRVFFKTIFIIF